MPIHVRGDTLPVTLTAQRADGMPYDLTGCTVTVHVHTATACVEAPGTVGNAGVVSFAPAPIDALAARAYRASLRVTRPDGFTETLTGHVVRVTEGCPAAPPDIITTITAGTSISAATIIEEAV